ncbi:MAG: thioredoxin domain-containing protein [Synergistaceae bacterium]|nr:thioredoxin domain-containing protein [Synergistaceae bacterium]
MPSPSSLLSSIEPLSAYGEYSDAPVITGKHVYAPANHLGGELSPYLLMHANDPVAWHTWGDNAFMTARREDKPLFVSIGYYSEHWCRVMQRECFSDKEVAGFLNEVCIPVCVDREERPDINDFFMEVCRLQNGSAGWPLNIFLTPEGKPFFCTTWLPKRTIGQMPGITEILPRIKWLWHVQRDDVEREAANLVLLMNARLEELSGSKFSGGRIGKIKAYEAVNDLRKVFDVRWGGFGGAPKFPETQKLLFLLRMAGGNSGSSGRDKSDALTMTDITLRRMWRGGIHDHLGGGVSRYAIDERWLVPHFEKLLYEQAMLLLAVSNAHELQPSSQFHRLFAEDIIACLIKYFCDDAAYSQGFRSSVCGDTREGEGKYYLWSEDEIKRILPEGDAGLFCAAYGVLPAGNFAQELGGSQMGQNILYEASTVTDLAKRYGIKGSEVGARLSECRRLMLNARDNRYPLLTDNKIILGWNGLMVGALSKASVVFGVSEWRDIAERTALFLQKNFRDKSGAWHRVWLSGKAYTAALSEDYAYFLWGVLELYKAVKHFSPDSEKQLKEWLSGAQEIADAMIAQCWDEKQGGLFLTCEDKYIFARMKSCDDINSMPNANSIAATALTQLGIILEEKKYTDYSRRIIECFAHYARENALASLTLIVSDIDWAGAKKKPEPKPEVKPVLTDEELNAPEPVITAGNEPEAMPEKRPARTARRTSERTERRRAGRARAR